VLSGEVSNASLDPTQVHFVTSDSVAELRVRQMPLSGLDPSILIGFCANIGLTLDAELQRYAVLTLVRA
jgi:hypothetical protein